MQLLDSLQIQTGAIPESLQVSLQDIINKVEIQSHFCIRHPDYKPLEVPSEAIPRFQQLPLAIQNKFLNQRLCRFLYGIYYNASLKRALAPDEDATNLDINQNLENNTYLGVDVAFYDRLHETNSGEGYLSYGWQVMKEETDGALAVQKEGLTLHIDRAKHLQPEAQTATVGDLVAIKMPKNLVQNGFYMAVGNATRLNDKGETVRVYFNLTPPGAVAVMGSLTAQLNAIAIAFKFKALYNPKDYGRYDSAVLYFDKSKYEAVHSVLERVYAEHQSHFQPKVPLFTKLLAPGLAIAEEPNQKFAEKESFGTNRCQIVANGLLEAWHKGDNTPEGRMTAIMQQFSLVNIELQRPYLNANSEDMYTPLKL
ncbi:T3SS effector HopA1 family protein [Mastigocladopsis repens]|uniref:T3SS effector HopA1 family protein n=1 Tax=Mastigocladopsis repens TaxID=221287 RepID=UPI0002E062D6|nr:T3SS effector HopA1 family protein [Mastigocladopsis repens]